MHLFKIPSHTQSIMVYMILTEYFSRNSGPKLHYGNVATQPNYNRLYSQG